ncbi:MAG: phosphoribosylformylglycinamidine synthase [Lachnospiraceae bacterium]|nr:phosphoribosylformylglycinamidine synthase [Lachnospiraceae bacterium]
MSGVRRIYVEKKSDFAGAAREVRHELRHYLGIGGVQDVRKLIRYDVEGVSDEVFERACVTVFSEPPVDDLYKEQLELPAGARIFSVEALPGQFDQRADSAEQCVRFIKEDEEPVIRTAVTYIITGDISDEEFEKIKAYEVNPVDSRVTDETKPGTLAMEYEEPADVPVLTGFCTESDEELKKLYTSLSLAMTWADFLWIRDHFRKEEHRDPSMTEIRVLDTYWSDHCRHTTFGTELRKIEWPEGDYRAPIEESFRHYQSAREERYPTPERQAEKPVCLMDIALMGMKKLKADGKLTDMEESEENNACTIEVPVTIRDNGEEKTETWLLFFKNETHNHPTEIEPFGGAATCLGGAIRDPLSGRGYVYQAMRVTGAADPTRPASETLPGKLSQKRLVRGAAAGYSSYGNQIGLATGFVREIYHPDYVAKRMEIGAVMGAAPKSAVRRESPRPGDIVILLGGRTGRDGIGGATGSSKAHDTGSITTCGAEVQKGNAPTERKLQRLFRRPEVAHLIRKCNDFGAGGVSVAIGELAPGLEVNLDLVPKKYAGLDGTELAISESQERMAVVIDPQDRDEFLDYAAQENLEATEVAVVTEDPRLVLFWRGRKIVDISRAFLDTNGAPQQTDVRVKLPKRGDSPFSGFGSEPVRDALLAGDAKKALLAALSDLNVASQRGLIEMFDSSIGAASVTMPFGGKYQMTPTQAMAAKLPVLHGETDAVSLMACGFDPVLSSFSPYHGAVYAVTQSIAGIVASGGDPRGIHFTFQEYFRRMVQDTDWSEPFTALLGAFEAQLRYGLASIGGKDSMSGSFNEIHVPPTLVSFAVDMANAQEVVTPEFKKAGNRLALIRIETDGDDLPVYDRVLEIYGEVIGLMRRGAVASCSALDRFGAIPAASVSAFGNGLGYKITSDTIKDLFSATPGDLLLEITSDMVSEAEAVIARAAAGSGWIGEVTAEPTFILDEKGRQTEIPADEALNAWTGTLEPVFRTHAGEDRSPVEAKIYRADGIRVCSHRVAKPTVFIPVFPGTNCEYDTARAFERAGAQVSTLVFKNRNAADIRESVEAFERAIAQAQIVMFPGGFSAGDEPDGSAKFFATAFRNEKIREAMQKLLDERDGLVLGICNGFQAIIKLGLVPEGRIIAEQTASSPTLTFNTIGRHISRMACLRVASNKSPWLALAEPGGVYVNPASHGEGRFVAPDDVIAELFANGQVATQYCDPEGAVSMDDMWNINGSYCAIEGITSPDGRCLGKMCHSERIGAGVAKNIVGEQDMKIFEAGVRYFR